MITQVMLTLGLFPAQAGVIPWGYLRKNEKITFPRASGGDPTSDVYELGLNSFSPRKRG